MYVLSHSISTTVYYIKKTILSWNKVIGNSYVNMICSVSSEGMYMYKLSHKDNMLLIVGNVNFFSH